MKKITFLIIFIITSITSLSQNVLGKYEVNFNGWYRGDNNHHCGEAFVDMQFDNPAYNFRALTINYWEDSPNAYVTNYKSQFNADRKPVSMYFSSSRRTRSSCSGPRPHNNGWITSNDKFKCLNFNFAFSQFYNPNDHEDIGLWNSSFNVKVYPLLTIINTSGDLPVEDKITINSHSGFALDEYNWEYTLNLNDFITNNAISLPLYNGSPSLNIDARDILGANAEIYHGQHIYFRQVACGGTVKSVNVADFVIRKSAPHIISTVAEATTCSYTNDGTVTFKFDRRLELGEKLYASLIDLNSNTPVILPNNSEIDISSDLTYKISNLVSSNYYFQLGPGNYNNENTYPLSLTHKSTFEIKKPDPVDFSLSKVDVWCHGGNDGSITINATGGNVLDATANGVRYYYSVNNGNWMPFSTETSHTLSNLLPGLYTIKVRDFKSCYARTPQDTDKEATETITQPASPVSLAYTQVLQPTFYGGTNGRLVAAIQGGTRFSDNSYQYEWRNSSNVLQTNVTASYDAGAATYYLTLNGIPSDTYTLTVRDKNFSSATNQVGCTVANSSQYLGQPDPIVVTLQVTKTISCHVANSFGDETDFDPTDGQRDESQDGIILATVTGGVPFTGFDNNGLPYKYYWTKEAANGTWVAWNDMDETAENLSHGNYALNVEDKNGIRLGVYVNNVLDQETPKIQFMQQPDKFELTFQKGDITCSSGSNGWLTAVPTGGTAPYFYEWTTGATTAQITNLIANNYFVKVTDSKGCIVQGSSTVEQPNGVAIQEVLTNPTCTSGSDGSIQIDITGGTLPYLYTWSTGQTTKDLTNLTAGNYTLTLEDGQGCIYYKDFVLTDPAPIVVNLGNDRTLCNGQNLDLDVTISDVLAQYSWTSSNGFTSTSPVVSLTNSGTYQCKVTSSKGCEASDTITISTSNVAISSEFFLSSQAYLNEEVILVNTSNPLGQNTIWDIPNTVTIVSQNENYIVLKFPAVGSYTISLKQTQGDCYAVYSKLITVEPKTINASIGNTSNPFISEFTVSPNPSSGDFSAIIKLEESSPIKLRLYALSGQVPLIEKYETGQKNYVVPFSINLAAGTYALILETAKQTLVKKIIIY